MNNKVNIHLETLEKAKNEINEIDMLLNNSENKLNTYNKQPQTKNNDDNLNT